MSARQEIHLEEELEESDCVFRYTDLQPVGMGAFGLVWYAQLPS